MMKFAAKVYTDDIFLGGVSGNSLSSIKRAATRKCNRYFRVLDMFALYRANGVEVADIKFMRVNRLCPNNTIQRGEWRQIMVERPEIVTDGKNFSFEYGVVNISHRLNINKPICHDEITLDRAVSVMLVNKTDGWEFQILYRDENFNVQCGIYKLNDYVVKIRKRGDMGIVL